MLAFQNRVIWITGASSGYGEAMCRGFSAQGAKLILSARNNEKLQQLANQLKNCYVLPLDLNQPETFAAKTQEAIEAFGHIDIQIHNGALAQNASALETKMEVARQIMQVDYFSYTELSQCLLPHFIQRKAGHIVVISGLLAKLTLPKRSSYAAAKAALLGYFGCLRAEVAAQNIAVTVLIPGALQTDLVNKALIADGSVIKAAGEKNSSGCPLDIAAQQSLTAILNREYEAYIGLQDESFVLWRLSQCDPTLGIKLLLQKLQPKP